MNVRKEYLPTEHPNRPLIRLESLKAIVVHYTQNEDPRATALINAKYIGRPFEKGDYYDAKKNMIVNGYIEKGSMGKGARSLGIPFRYGSAHVFCDQESIVETIPIDEVAWGCGDKNYKGGYQRVAYKVFNCRQNYQTISVEICNNDVIKNSNEDWKKAVYNAFLWIGEFMKQHEYKLDLEGSLKPQMLEKAPPTGSLLLLRHYDLTGKICPKPFVDSQEDWEGFVKSIYNYIQK